MHRVQQTHQRIVESENPHVETAYGSRPATNLCMHLRRLQKIVYIQEEPSKSHKVLPQEDSAATDFVHASRM